MKIINTGGTFNKRYNPLNGELFVPRDDIAISEIVSKMVIDVEIEGIIYKDSLEFDDSDRAHLLETIKSSDDDTIIVVHGTDTMHLSAKVVADVKIDKVIVFTGAMVPFAVDKIEATVNLSMAIGYSKNLSKGVYISMQGVLGKYDRVVKNKELGRFIYV